MAKTKKAPKANKASPTKATKDDPIPDTNELTVSDIARELDMSPKIARAKLRKAGKAAVDGRWPTVKRDSKAHQEIVAIISAEPSGE